MPSNERRDDITRQENDNTELDKLASDVVGDLKKEHNLGYRILDILPSKRANPSAATLERFIKERLVACFDDPNTDKVKFLECFRDPAFYKSLKIQLCDAYRNAKASADKNFASSIETTIGTTISQAFETKIREKNAKERSGQQPAEPITDLAVGRSTETQWSTHVAGLTQRKGADSQFPQGPFPQGQSEFNHSKRLAEQINYMRQSMA